MKRPNYFTTDFPARRSRNQRPIRLATKITKMSFGFGHNRPRAYRRDAGYSIYLGFFVLLVAIDPSRLASIFEDSNTDGHGLRRQAIPVWIGGSYPCKSVKSVVKIPVSVGVEVPLKPESHKKTKDRERLRRNSTARLWARRTGQPAPSIFCASSWLKTPEPCPLRTTKIPSSA